MYLVLVAGGHASGKKTVTREIVELLEKEVATKQYSFEIKTINLCNYSQPEHYHPESVDFSKLKEDLDMLNSQNTNSVVFVYGNYALYNTPLCELASLKLFLDTDADERLSRWILRDAVFSTKLQLAEVLTTYLERSRIEYTEYIEGTKTRADVLLPQGSDPLTAEVIVSGIISKLTSIDQPKGEAKRPVISLKNEENGTFYITD